MQLNPHGAQPEYSEQLLWKFKLSPSLRTCPFCGTRRPACHWEEKCHHIQNVIFNTQRVMFHRKIELYPELPRACSEAATPTCRRGSHHPPSSTEGQVGCYSFPLHSIFSSQLLSIPHSAGENQRGQYAHLLHFMYFFPLCICLSISPIVFLLSPSVSLFSLLLFVCLLSREQITQPIPSLSPDWHFLLRPQASPV